MVLLQNRQSLLAPLASFFQMNYKTGQYFSFHCLNRDLQDERMNRMIEKELGTANHDTSSSPVTRHPEIMKVLPPRYQGAKEHQDTSFFSSRSFAFFAAIFMTGETLPRHKAKVPQSLFFQIPCGYFPVPAVSLAVTIGSYIRVIFSPFPDYKSSFIIIQS